MIAADWVRIQNCSCSIFLLILFTCCTILILPLITSLLHLYFPFLLLLRSHFVFFSQDKVNLKRIGKEDHGRIVEEVGSGRVVVSLEFYKVLIARVRFV